MNAEEQHLELVSRNVRLRSSIEKTLESASPDIRAAVMKVVGAQEHSDDVIEQARITHDNLRQRANLLVRSGVVAPELFAELLHPTAR